MKSPIVVALCLAGLPGVYAQPSQIVTGITNMTTPLAVAPGNPQGVYPLNGFESIDTYTGKVNIAVPLVPISGRGASPYSITAAVKNYSWQVQLVSYPQQDQPGQAPTFDYAAAAVLNDGMIGYGYGALYGPGTIVFKYTGSSPTTCDGVNYYMEQTYSELIFAAPDGTEHPLFPVTSGSQPGNNVGFQPYQTNVCPGGISTQYNRGPLFAANDGSNLWFQGSGTLDLPDASSYPNGPVYILGATGTLFFPNGTQYAVENGMVQSLTDRNGNRTSFAYLLQNGFATNLVSTIMDSTGRQYTISYNGCTVDSSAPCDTITYPVYPQASGGTSESIRVHYAKHGSQIRSDLGVTGSLFKLSTVTESIDNGLDLSQIDLPNGTFWKFFYSAYGEIAKVILPTGGAIEYDYGPGLWPNAPTNSPSSTLMPGVFASGQVLTDIPMEQSTSWNPFIYRRLLQRREYPGAIGGETNLERSANYPGTAGTTTRTTSYNLFETASNPRQETMWGKTPEGDWPVISIAVTGGTPTITESGANMPSLQIAKQFYNQMGAYGGETSPTSPASDMCPQGNSCQPNFVTVSDSFQGKEYDTKTTLGNLMVEQYKVYGTQANGTAVEVCQENTTYTYGASTLTSAALSLYDELNGTPYAPGYQFGNLTDVYEFDFGTAPALPALTYDGSRPCPSQAPSGGYSRRVQTDYLNNSGYVALTAVQPAFPTFLPSLVSVTREYDGSNAGKYWSQTTYGYDASAPSLIGATQAAYCSSAVTKRGNVTSISKLLSNTEPFVSGTAITDNITYDCVGNVTSYKDPNGNTASIDYTDQWLGTSSPGSVYAYPTTVSLANGIYYERSYDYNSGKPTQEMGPASGQSPSGLVTQWQFADPLNRLTHIDRGVGLGGTIEATTDVAYSDVLETGNFATSVDVRHDQYGTSQRLHNMTAYDGLGRPVFTQNIGAKTIETQKQYDGLGRVYQECNPVYTDAASPTDGCTTYTYDALGRVVGTTLPDGSTTSTQYGVSGNYQQAVVVDEAEKQRTLEHDSFGRLRQVVDPGNSSSVYTYDLLNNLTGVTMNDTSGVSGAVQERNFTYDSLKRLLTAANPETGTVGYTYDANGNLTSKTDARGVIACYGNLNGQTCDGQGYDQLNRLTNVSYYTAGTTAAATPGTVHCYDGNQYLAGGSCGKMQNGMLLRKTGVGNSNAWTNYSFDAAGRMTSSSQYTGSGGTPSYTFAYTYFNDDSLASEGYPSGRTIEDCYDANGRLTWVSGNATAANCTSSPGSYAGTGPAYGQVTGYVPTGQISALTLGNGLVETIIFNSRRQMVGLTAAAAAATRLSLGLSYCASASVAGCPGNNGNLMWQTISYGAAGNQGASGNVSESAFTVTQQYGYDGVNRLTSFAESALGQGYGYDGFGNRVESDTNVNTTGYSAVAPGSMSDYNAATNQIRKMTPDAAGNLQAIGPFALSYDAEGRMTQALETGVVTASYMYDGEGRRVGKVLAGSTSTLATVYVYDGFGRLGAEYGGPVEDSGTRYLTADHLGSTRLVTDGSGNAVRRNDYFPFGRGMDAGMNGRSGLYSVGAYPEQNPATADGGDGVAEKFTGKERDAETGLDYFGARYFSAAQGRFTSPDPMNHPSESQFGEEGFLAEPQRWNKYAYALNNPLRNIDPDGYETQATLDDKQVREAGEGISNVLVGAAKGLWNAAAGTANLLNNFINAESRAFAGHNLVATVPEAQYDNTTQAVAGIIAPLAVAAQQAFSEAGALQAARPAAAESGAAVPESIPAGPSARPRAAQQSKINEMGDAHGCSTCGATSPGTKSGNWVGDHQPPTALNTTGGPQVYRPQCLQCSRQQGGQVAAAAKAAKKAACANGATTCQ